MFDSVNKENRIATETKLHTAITALKSTPMKTLIYLQKRTPPTLQGVHLNRLSSRSVFEKNTV